MFLSHIQFLQGSVRVIRDACKKGGQRITKSGGIPLLKASNSIDNPTVDLSTSGFQIMCCPNTDKNPLRTSLLGKSSR